METGAKARPTGSLSSRSSKTHVKRSKTSFCRASISSRSTSILRRCRSSLRRLTRCLHQQATDNLLSSSSWVQMVKRHKSNYNGSKMRTSTDTRSTPVSSCWKLCIPRPSSTSVCVTTSRARTQKACVSTTCSSPSSRRAKPSISSTVHTSNAYKS